MSAAKAIDWTRALRTVKDHRRVHVTSIDPASDTPVGALVEGIPVYFKRDGCRRTDVSPYVENVPEPPRVTTQYALVDKAPDGWYVMASPTLYADRTTAEQAIMALNVVARVLIEEPGE